MGLKDLWKWIFFCSVSRAWYPPVLCCWLVVCSCGLLQSHSWGDEDTTALSEASDNQGAFIKIHLVTVTQPAATETKGTCSQWNCQPKHFPAFSCLRFLDISLYYFYHSFPFVFLQLLFWDFQQPVRGTVPVLTLLYSWKIMWECSARYVLWHDYSHFWQWINVILFFIMQSILSTDLCA